MNVKYSIFLFHLICSITLKAHANQKTEAPGPIIENILILGSGSEMGANYKVDIFQRLRPLAKKVYLCEQEGNTLAKKLYDENLVDEIVFLKHCECYKKQYRNLKTALSKKHIPVDAVVTYRDEWLKIRSMLAHDYNLPHQDFKAVYTSQDKQKTRETLHKEGFENPKYQIGELKNLDSICINIGFPVFIKPNIGIRSEWGRKVDGLDDLKKYVENIKKFPRIAKSKFLVEEFMNGHEVDCDIVLWNGKLLYAKTSDNFPVHNGFGLETGHLMPSILDQGIQDRISEYAYKAALALGYDRGVLHVELMLQPNGDIILIELNGRLGGMYIAKWHQQVWDVDLIRSELAISMGVSPEPWLKTPLNPNKSLAQLCITSNSKDIKEKYEDREIVVMGWDLKSQKDIEPDTYLNNWVNYPLKRDICINGHPNLGEITVSAPTPLQAFQKLYEVCESNTIEVKTDNKSIEATYKPILNFCSNTYGYKRFSIEESTNNDITSIQSLLPFLSSRATKSCNKVPDIPIATKYFLAKDSMVPDKPVVGMVAMHVWQRVRSNKPLTCYIHDLVVSPYYRNIGIAKKLLEHAINQANRLGVGKIDIACEQDLINFYTRFGFSSVGTHMVKYLDLDKNIQEKGEWIYGQDLVLNKITPYNGNIIIPKHFFIPELSQLPIDLCKEIHEYKASFSVKYSLRDSRAFSHQRLRGENSSRGRVLKASKLSPQEIAQSITKFSDEAPESCAGIVLQEFIDQSGGCLFHAEISQENISIDTLWENDTSRAFARFTDKSLVEYEEILGKRLPKNQRYECHKIYKNCKDIFKILSNIHPEISQWSVEGFWKNEEEKLIVLQLRPTPHDKPVSETRDVTNEVYSTNFSWGNYETPSLDPERLLNGEYENIIIRKESESEIINPNILTKLASGKTVLLIDICRGFNLSHEKWFLPPPNLRKNFSFIHVPYKTLLALKSQFKIVSSGNKGYIVLADK